MGRTVLVTGASGFLARQVCELFNSSGWHVITTVRSLATLPKYDSVSVDLKHPESLERVFEISEVDCIIHLASNVNFGENSNDIFVENIISTGLIASHCARRKIHLIFASSVAVYDAKNCEINESSAINPASSYGRSKFLAEELIRFTGALALVIRFGGIFGLRGPLHLGLNKSICAVLSGERPLLFGLGEGRRNYLYVKDAAEMLLAAAESRVTGTCIAGGSEVLSIREMITCVCEMLSPGITPLCLPGEAGSDHIVTHSGVLPAGRSFKNAILDIRADALA